MATATPTKCHGPACGTQGFRAPAGVNGTALACRVCDGPQLVTGPLLPRPPGGYDRSHFEGTK